MKRLLLIFWFGILLTAGCVKYNPVEPGDIDDPENYKVRNGGFEESTDGVLPNYWQFSVTGNPEFNFYSINEEDVKEGKRSLKINYIDSLANPDEQLGSWGGLHYKIETDKWDVNATYKIAFWVKAVQGNFHVRVVKNGKNDNTFVFYTANNLLNWEYLELPFQITEDTEYINILISTKDLQSSNGRVIGWVDDVRILR